MLDAAVEAVEERGEIRAGQGEVGPRLGEHGGERDSGVGQRLGEGIDVLAGGAPHLDGVESGGGRGADPVGGVRAGLGEEQFDVG